ncbi:MAG: ASPIC/UnbV domain-containing protein [Pseudomonadota bacterium]
MLESFWGKSKAPFESDGPYELFRNLGGDNHWLEIDLEGVSVNRDAVGARVVLSAGGRTQVREQRNGMHFRAQDHARLHFGLGEADEVDSLVVHWPNGTTQTVTGPVPADHLLEIAEQPAASVLGAPKSVPGAARGVFLWKDSFDGDYRLRVRGDGVSSNYRISVIADAAPLSVTRVSLERPDALTERPFGFDWTGQVTNREDGVDFALPPGARALVSLTRDDEANPRQLQLGSERVPLAPAGWIVPVAALAQPPAFAPGQDLGLYAGRSGNTVVANWSAAGAHSVALELSASDAFLSATPQGLEPGDSFAVTGNVVTVTSAVQADVDGVQATLPSDAKLAISYVQDGLFQRRRVALALDGFEQPNAYRLPVADPIGRPTPTDERGGLSLWREPQLPVWTLRIDGGRTGAAASGRFRTGGRLRVEARSGLDKNDDVTVGDGLRTLEFALTARPGETVAVSFRADPRGSLSLDLDRRRGTARALAIGAEGWPVARFPVRLN